MNELLRLMIDSFPKILIPGLTMTLPLTAIAFSCAMVIAVAAALGVRCGSAFHVIWNQERNAAGLDQTRDEDTDSAIRVGIEAVKLLITRDREKN